MLDRRGFFGWLAGIVGLGAVKEVQAVQTSEEARPLFVLTLEKDLSIEAVQRFKELWSKDHPDWDLVVLPEGNTLEVANVPFVQTIEQINGHLLNIVAPDLATYERLRELCVPKPHVVQYEPACTPEESAEHLERLAKIREAWEKEYGNSINPLIPLEIHNR